MADRKSTNLIGKQTAWPAGEVVRLQYQSKVLADNPLGDPAERTLTVWLPPNYSKSQRALPVLFDLVGYTGSGPGHANWNAFAENVPERLDRLHHSGKLPSCIVVFPDCFTALGGNQYINSSALGRYADYLTQELIPLVDKEFRTLAAREHRACFGKSSGGYGAMVHGMRYSKYWGAIGNHSGDSGFELVYGGEWPQVLTHLSAYRNKPQREGNYQGNSPSAANQKSEQQLRAGLDDGRVANFLQHHWSNDRPSGDDIMCLMLLAMAATYDPDPKAPNGFRLPVHANTAERLPSRWRRWLQHDPIEMVAKHAKALRGLKAIHMDCGWRDQYHIHFGMRQLSAALTKHKVQHRYQEFNGTHSGVDHRMDISLPYLAKAIR